MSIYEFSSFVKRAECFFAFICIDWLPTSDFRNFDFAACNSKLRTIINKVFQLGHFKAYGFNYDLNGMPQSFLKWWKYKDIKIRNLKLIATNNNELTNWLAVQHLCDQLEKLECRLEQYLCPSSMICDSLLSLTLHGWLGFITVPVLTAILKCNKLEFLSIQETIEKSGYDAIIQKSFQVPLSKLHDSSITNRLPNLTTFHLLLSCKKTWKSQSSDIVSLITSQAPCLENISFLGTVYLRAETYISIAEKYPKLKQFILPERTATDVAEMLKIFVFVDRDCPLLPSLQHFKNHLPTNDVLMEQIAYNCPNLLSLTLIYYEHGYTPLTEYALHMIGTGCPLLQTIQVECFMAKHCDVTAERIVRLVPSLTSLTLTRDYNFFDEHAEPFLHQLFVSDPAAIKLSKNNNSKKSNKKHNDDDDENIAKIINPNVHLAPITTWDLTQFSNLTNKGVALLCTAFPAITSLNISYCSHVSDEAVCSIATMLPLLTTLDVSGCCWITDNVFDFLTAGINTNSSAAGSSVSKNNSNGGKVHRLAKITSGSKKQNSSNNSRNNNGCDTSGVIFQLLQHFTASNKMRMKTGTKLDSTGKSIKTVVECWSLGNLPLEKLINHCCATLLSINIAYSSKITNKLVKRIAVKCKALQQLDISYCAQLTDGCFASLQPGDYVQLSKLNLTASFGLTETSIHNIVAQCRGSGLSEIEICRCKSDMLTTAVRECCFVKVSSECDGWCAENLHAKDPRNRL